MNCHVAGDDWPQNKDVTETLTALINSCLAYIQHLLLQGINETAHWKQGKECTDYASSNALNATRILLNFGTVARVGLPLTTLNDSGPTSFSSKTLPISM